MIFDRLWGRPEQKTVDATALTWEALLGGQSSKTGASVNIDTALRVAVAYACSRVLTEDVGKLPLKLMRETDDGRKVVAREHPVHRLIFRRPNEWQTSMEWRMTMLLHALFARGGYSYINRAGPKREPVELVPMMPQYVRPVQDRARRLWYELSDVNGPIGRVPREDMHVIHGLSWNGYSALPVIEQGREALGLAMATEESQARLHGNGSRPSGILSTDQVLTDDQIERIRASFADNYGGLHNAFKTVLLDGGLKFTATAMTGVDAQHLETRRHQVEEVCRFFRVFPSMIGYSDKATTYASAEAFFTAHVIHSLMPWITLWEQAMSRDLLTEEEIEAGYHPKFFVNGLLRGDAASRASFYESAITKACWMSRNDARRLEDMDPMPGLDEFLQPLNLATTDAAAPGKKPPPADDQDGDEE